MFKRFLNDTKAKLLKLLSNIQLVPLCLFAYILKTLVVTPSYAESIIVIALSALYGWYILMRSRIIPEPTKQMVEEIKALKNQIAGIKMKMGIRSSSEQDQKKKRYF